MRRVLLPILVLLALLVTGWLAWLKVPSPASATLQSELHRLADGRACAGLQIVGVRGHSDPPTSVGPDVQALVNRLQARLGPSGPADVVPLPYEQGPTLGIVPIWVPRDVAAGADALDQYLRLRAARCPTERRVVIAQSEGSALVHLALPRTASEAEVTVLLGDPLRLNTAPYDEDFGPSSNGELVPWMGMGIDLARRTWADPVTASAAGRIRSYCLPHDQVCSNNVFDRHRNTHTDYRNDPSVPPTGRGVLDLAADFILGRVQAQGG